jgi:hypothetical protein
MTRSKLRKTAARRIVKIRKCKKEFNDKKKDDEARKTAEDQ